MLKMIQKSIISLITNHFSLTGGEASSPEQTSPIQIELNIDKSNTDLGSSIIKLRKARESITKSIQKKHKEKNTVSDECHTGLGFVLNIYILAHEINSFVLPLLLCQ